MNNLPSLNNNNYNNSDTIQITNDNIFLINTTSHIHLFDISHYPILSKPNFALVATYLTYFSSPSYFDRSIYPSIYPSSIPHNNKNETQTLKHSKKKENN
jgi:hypothetical protein